MSDCQAGLAGLDVNHQLFELLLIIAVPEPLIFEQAAHHLRMTDGSNLSHLRGWSSGRPMDSQGGQAGDHIKMPVDVEQLAVVEECA